MNSVGSVIRENRKSKGLLLRQLSAVLDVDVAVLSKIERGERIPSKLQIEKIAKALKMDVNILIEKQIIDKILIELSDSENPQEILMKVNKELKSKK